MSRGLPYSLRLAMASAMKDQKASDAIVLECFEDITQELLGLTHEYDRSDLPFVIATMKIVSNSLMQVLNDSGREIVEKLTKNTACVMVDLDELRRQAKEGAEDGGDEKC